MTEQPLGSAGRPLTWAHFDAVGAEADITVRLGDVEHRVALSELV